MLDWDELAHMLVQSEILVAWSIFETSLLEIRTSLLIIEAVILIVPQTLHLLSTEAYFELYICDEQIIA